MNCRLIYKTRSLIGLFAIVFVLAFLSIGCILSIPFIVGRSAYYIFVVYGPLFILGAISLLCQIPRAYMVFTDRIEIKTLLWTWKLPYETILYIIPCMPTFLFKGPSWKPLLSTKNCVRIERVKGWPFLISPVHREEFLKYAQGALEEWKSTSKKS
ncbi:MAG: hypothetical protein DRP84_10590 [Spirochaetes bacterium]|nr:MAG: hypothetical protein DRP84_10590 [Spirochaetota bacterium]